MAGQGFKIDVIALQVQRVPQTVRRVLQGDVARQERIEQKRKERGPRIKDEGLGPKHRTSVIVVRKPRPIARIIPPKADVLSIARLFAAGKITAAELSNRLRAGARG